MPTPTTQKGTLTPEATRGLEYLKTINPTLAASISKSFSPASAAPIDASILGGTSNVTVSPPPVTPVSDYSKVTISTPAPIVNTARQDELDAGRDVINSDIDAAEVKLGTKSARKSELETAQGIPGLNTQLNEINNLIRGEQSAALAANNKSEDRLAPTFAIRGEQAQIERQRAVKVYAWSAAAEAIQGNITLANDYVQRTLSEEFDHLEKQIEHKERQLTENRDNWTREEARAAEARQRGYEQEKEELAQKREDRQSVLNIMLQAAQAGADNATLSQIQVSTSPEQAIALAGRALGAEFEQRVTQQKFENNLALRNVALDEAKFAYQKFADAEAKKGNQITATTAQGLASVLGGSKVGQATKTSVGTILGVISAVEDLSKSRPDGQFAGFYPGAAAIEFFLPAALKRTATVENEGYLNAINLKVQQWASGATLTESQTKLVYGMVPKKNDSDTVIKTKLNNLTNFMQQQIKGSLLSEGISYEPEKVDLWAPQKSLADIMNE
jgi:hypothetical protein